MDTQNQITVKELKKLEKKQLSNTRRLLNRTIALLPAITLFIHYLEYSYVPNHGLNQATKLYGNLLILGILVFFIWYLASFVKEEWYEKLLYLTPLFSVIWILLTIYDLLTLKSGRLILPYFPWIGRVLDAMISDWVKLLDCVKNSLKLLFTGYFTGVLAGLLCGVLAGWSKRVNYWIQPLVRVLGAIPSTTYMPIIMILSSSLFGGSAFLIALGVWFPVTISSINGVSGVHKNYYEVARTLGTSKIGILFRVVMPAAMPSIFTGLTQGMSTACLTLMVAEMMGVESGLGWYINWQKGWAEFAKMYGAIIIICITFILVNCILNLIKKRVLRWQGGE
ncbi:MAG: ABC transporter permease subunit [Clostridiales bacterium]|nr:ABC transporter permease subunit [Clostridiales bacterium]